MSHLQATYSPISDPGYGSSSSTPWLDGKGDRDCDSSDGGRFPSPSRSPSISREGSRSPEHTLLDIDAFPDTSLNASFDGYAPGSPTPPPAYSSVNSTPKMGSSFANRRAAGISLANIKPPSIRLDMSNVAPPSAWLQQQHDQQRAPQPFTESATFWLVAYFFFNLGLTLYNKFALVSFPFPFSLTCIHSCMAGMGSLACYKRGYFTRVQSLGMRENLILVAFSSLYTINIAVSNLSLNLVTVPLHQVVRSTTPLFTILISVILFRKSYLFETYLSLLPVILGVCLATYGDYSGTTWGVCLTLFGAWLAAVKGIATNRILVGRLKFHPLDLLLRMSPLAFGQCLVFSYLSGELGEVYHRTFVTGSLTRGQWFSLAINGSIAFGLNVVSFTANKKTGALTMSVAANVKQVLTIVLAVVLFNLTINGVNFLGISLTIAGGAYYSYIEYKAKQGPKVPGISSAPPFTPAIPVPQTPLEASAHMYEKRSPRSEHFGNPFLSVDQNVATPPRQMASSSYDSNSEKPYHRKSNSLAGFQYPARNGEQQLSPPPI